LVNLYIMTYKNVYAMSKKLKVWVVYDSIIEQILGVYDTEEKARNAAKDNTGKRGYATDVEEFEVQ